MVRALFPSPAMLDLERVNRRRSVDVETMAVAPLL